ncbi:MAG: DUF1294 domain-containing protein [Anaerolineae bacterium]
MKRQSYEFFGFLSLALIVLSYIALDRYTSWSPYRVWIAACSAATLAIYGLDKGISKVNGARPSDKSLSRAPENLLHLLALLGGFPGGWLGMIFFGHKTNFRKHPSIWFFLCLGTALHVMLTKYHFFGAK